MILFGLFPYFCIDQSHLSCNVLVYLLFVACVYINPYFFNVNAINYHAYFIQGVKNIFGKYITS